MMGVTGVQMGKLEMRAVLEASSICGLIWVSECSVLACAYIHALLFCMLEIWSIQFN